MNGTAVDRRGRLAGSRAVVALLVLALAGCEAMRNTFLELPRSLGLLAPVGPQLLSENELSLELAAFVTRLAASLGSLGSALAGPDASAAERLRSLQLRAQLVPLAQQYALDPDPRTAYVALLSLMELLNQYVRDGEGRSEFGARQQQVLRSLRELQEDLLQLGAHFMPPSELAALRERVERFARENPLRRGLVATQAQEVVSTVRTADWVGSVLRLPMAPFRALEGVNEGAAAVYEFAQIAQVLTAITATLPAQLRWQSELLLLAIEQNPTARSLVDSAQALAQGAQSLGAAVQSWPADLSELLEGSGGALSELQRTLAQAQSLSRALGRTARDVGAAGQEWAAVFSPGDEPRAAQDAPAYSAHAERDGHAAQEPVPPDAEEDSAAREWGVAAQQVGSAAQRVESAAHAVRLLLESPRALRGVAAVSGAVQGAERSVGAIASYALAAAAALGAALMALVWGLVWGLRRRPLP